MGNSDFRPDNNSSQLPAAKAAARWLFIILGIIWLMFGAWSITRMIGDGGDLSNTMLGIISLLMFVNAAVMIWIGWRIGTGQRLYYYFGIILLASNIFLTLTDEFGIFDLAVLVLAIVLLLLMLLTRSQYLTN